MQRHAFLRARPAGAARRGQGRGRRRLAALLLAVMWGVLVPAPARAAAVAPLGQASGQAQPGQPLVQTGKGPVTTQKGQPTQPGKGQSGQPTAPLTLESPAAVLMEAKSGAVLFAKNPHQRRHPASVTKIMTLIVIYDAIRAGQVSPSDMVTTSENAARLGGTTAFLEVGETVPLADLIKAIAVGSANDAAVAAAEHVAGSEEAFVARMNQKAAELGLKDTHFANVHGFDDPNHYTSAHDIAVMSRYLVNQYPEVLQLSKIFLDKMRHPDGRETELLNRNRLVRFYDWVDGLKTGWTNLAGYSIAATGARGGTRMIAVILGAPDAKTRQAEALKLLEYGLAQYTTVTLARAGQAVAQVPVVRGLREQVVAVPKGDLAATVPRAEARKVTWRYTVAPQVLAPVAAGQPLGEAVAEVDGREVARVPLVAAATVPRIGLGQALIRAAGRVFSLRWP